MQAITNEKIIPHDASSWLNNENIDNGQENINAIDQELHTIPYDSYIKLLMKGVAPKGRQMSFSSKLMKKIHNNFDIILHLLTQEKLTLKFISKWLGIEYSLFVRLMKTYLQKDLPMYCRRLKHLEEKDKHTYELSTEIDMIMKSRVGRVTSVKDILHQVEWRRPVGVSQLN